MPVKHRRAFFHALDYWIRRHPISLEPSGLFTAVWCLLQVTSILEFTEADWKTYLLLPGEDHHFTVDHVEKVKSKPDLLDKLAEQKVSILGDMDAALSRLVSNQELMFLTPKVREFSTSLNNYLQIQAMQNEDVDFTTIRLTRIRNARNWVREFRPKKFRKVDTNGFKAKSLILFPHSTTIEPESSDAVSVRVLKHSYDFWDWRPVRLGYCIFSIASVIDNDFKPDDVEKSRLTEWRFTLARLLERLANLIGEPEPRSHVKAFGDLRQAVNSNDERWRIIQKCAKDFLDEHSKTEHSSSGKERLVFLRPSDTRTKKIFLSDDGLVEKFLSYAGQIESFFTVGPSPRLTCPECPRILESRTRTIDLSTPIGTRHMDIQNRPRQEKER